VFLQAVRKKPREAFLFPSVRLLPPEKSAAGMLGRVRNTKNRFVALARVPAGTVVTTRDRAVTAIDPAVTMTDRVAIMTDRAVIVADPADVRAVVLPGTAGTLALHPGKGATVAAETGVSAALAGKTARRVRGRAGMVDTTARREQAGIRLTQAATVVRDRLAGQGGDPAGRVREDRADHPELVGRHLR